MHSWLTSVLSQPQPCQQGNNNPLQSWLDWFSGWKRAEPKPGKGPHLETPGILGLAILFLQPPSCIGDFKGPGLFGN